MDIETVLPDYHTFNFEEGNYKTTYTRKYQNRKAYEAPDPRKVYGFIPGTVMKVYVKEKQRVKKGEPLLILQAMKMNNIIAAPINGVIKKVYVKVGDMVPKIQMLVEFK
ncbi:MAG: acetyl-CoA carboxylase biotin carboxyl carrier protein subunit [Bacteroidetes bacterium]|nr:acetyl-CoA carboxylase biotin carboxyl carrier protein subunit [Bacteroidota bacterium]MCX6248501.1 acetyl-CoA carboxylase biotin carboxyl carrier protein subunit [Bacteroidota bacterium]